MTGSTLLLLAVGAACAAALPAPDGGASQYGAPPAIGPSFSSPAPDTGYGAPACQPQTEYITITSTKLEFETKFNSRRVLEPTTLYRELTDTQFLPSTVTQTQVITSYGAPEVRASTKVLYGTKYVTKQEYYTETAYATRTRTVTYSDTVVVSSYYTETTRVPNYVTRTEYRSQVVPEVRYITQTQVQTQYVTETRQEPRYVTQTVTSGYPEYKYVTQTETQNQYVTVTRTQNQNQYVTVCPKPSYPSYGK